MLNPACPAPCDSLSSFVHPPLWKRLRVLTFLLPLSILDFSLGETQYDSLTGFFPLAKIYLSFSPPFFPAILGQTRRLILHGDPTVRFHYPICCAEKKKFRCRTRFAATSLSDPHRAALPGHPFPSFSFFLDPDLLIDSCQVLVLFKTHWRSHLLRCPFRVKTTVGLVFSLFSSFLCGAVFRAPKPRCVLSLSFSQRLIDASVDTSSPPQPCFF